MWGRQKGLRRNHFDVVVAQDVAQARAAVLEMIPVGATVGVGDSVSVRQLEVLDVLEPPRGVRW